MRTIQNGFVFQLNRDGTELVCGYQHGCKWVHLADGAETFWPLAGEWYPCGWQGALPVLFQPTAVSPPQTLALTWDRAQIGTEEEAIGHAGLAVIDGRRLSTNGTQLFLDGAIITPEPFLGVVWDDTECFAYKRGWDGGGPFVVRRTADNGVVRQIDDGGIWERVYLGGSWVTGQYPGGSRVYAPNGYKTLPAGELAGPVVQVGGVVYVVSAVMGAVNNPRGVMVRPWEELLNGTLRGWYCDDIRHQSLQARVTPQGDILVAGVEFPGNGTITVELIPKDRPMGLVPPEVEIPVPVPPDPPKPKPPVWDAVLHISPVSGEAPLKVQARAYDMPPGPYRWQQRLYDGAWLSLVVTDEPEHFYTFQQAGLFNVRCEAPGGVVTNERQVEVSEPPPPPEPTKPGRVARVLRAIKRWWDGLRD